MTRNEIYRGLRHHLDDELGCVGCPYRKLEIPAPGRCYALVVKDALVELKECRKALTKNNLGLIPKLIAAIEQHFELGDEPDDIDCDGCTYDKERGRRMPGSCLRMVGLDIIKEFKRINKISSENT